MKQIGLPRSTDRYEIWGEQVEIRCDSAAVRDFIHDRWGIFALTAPSPSVTKAVLYLVDHEDESPVSKGGIFTDDRTLIIADTAKLITGTFGGVPWHVTIQTYR